MKTSRNNIVKIYHVFFSICTVFYSGEFMNGLCSYLVVEFVSSHSMSLISTSAGYSGLNIHPLGTSNSSIDISAGLVQFLAKSKKLDDNCLRCFFLYLSCRTDDVFADYVEQFFA